MKIKLNTRYRINQTVWVIDNWCVWKGIISSIKVTSKEYYEYQLDFGGHYEDWPEELIYRTKKEANEKLNIYLHGDVLPILKTK